MKQVCVGERAAHIKRLTPFQLDRIDGPPECRKEIVHRSYVLCLADLNHAPTPEPHESALPGCTALEQRPRRLSWPRRLHQAGRAPEGVQQVNGNHSQAPQGARTLQVGHIRTPRRLFAAVLGDSGGTDEEQPDA